MMSGTDPRPVTPLDLPLVRRAIQRCLPLDTAMTLTRGLPGLEDVVLSSVPLADLGAPTVLLRHNESAYVGQFRQREDKSLAHLTFLAPEPEEDHVQDWAALLEGIAFEAGKRGVHVINAEVAENHPVFQAFRLAGFVVYSRQVVLQREPGRIPASDHTLVRPMTDQDVIAINTLYTNTVPRLLQQAEPLVITDCDGLVCERGDHIAGYLAIMEGKNGIVIKPYFHPEVYEQVSAIILAALNYLPQAEYVPVYLYARAYQDWLRGVLDRLEFRSWTDQALMVKYTVVRSGRAELALPGLETAPLRPPVVDGPMPSRLSRLGLSRFSLSRLTKFNNRSGRSTLRSTLLRRAAHNGKE
jgi:hypothetical protein